MLDESNHARLSFSHQGKPNSKAHRSAYLKFDEVVITTAKELDYNNFSPGQKRIGLRILRLPRKRSDAEMQRSWRIFSAQDSAANGIAPGSAVIDFAPMLEIEHVRLHQPYDRAVVLLR